MKWKDNYNRTIDINTEKLPSVLIADIKNIRIVIHTIVGCKDDWFLSCGKLGIDSKCLWTNDFDAAVTLAKQYISSEMDELKNTVAKFLEEND